MAPDTSGELGTIIGVWAHPDDEAYLAAGLMARSVDAGRRVVCVTATQGEAGFRADDPRPAEERKAVRRAELAASLAILGVREHHWLGYGDGRCAAVPDDEAVDLLLPILDDVRPDTVLTFGPDGATGHPDHIAAHRWATLAVERSRLPGVRLLYATKTHDWDRRFLVGVDPALITMVEDLEPEAFDADALAVHFTCDDALVERKVQALRAQQSQVEPIIQLTGSQMYREMVREEFFREPGPEDRDVMAAVLALKLR
jgi:LmbE family N-acetylglucosaminyl deacetylase